MPRRSLGWRAVLVLAAAALFLVAHVMNGLEYRLPVLPVPSGSPVTSPSSFPSPSAGATSNLAAADIVVDRGVPDPATFRAVEDQPVSWRNDGPSPCVLHTDGDQALPGGSAIVEVHELYRVTFHKTGTYAYGCADGQDAELQGEVKVKASPRPDASPTSANPTSASPTTTEPSTQSPSTAGRPSRQPTRRPTVSPTPTATPSVEPAAPSATPTV